MAKISVFCIASLGRQVVLGLGDDVCKKTLTSTQSVHTLCVTVVRVCNAYWYTVTTLVVTSTHPFS